jgi:hypothetical protein
MNRTSLLLSAALLCPLAPAQWLDIQRLGTGGEAYLSTDGKGNVYATSHQPCKLYVSNDFGKTFNISHSLPDSFCDVTHAVGPDGRLYVVYIKPGVKGLQVVTSSNKGVSLGMGGSIDGPYDREWIVVNPVTGEVGINYSDGYIGGPKSKGIFFSSSSDGGKTFKQLSRVDNEIEGSYAVDPYLAVGTGGRLYSAWAISTDYDHIDGYKFAASEDGGKTWKYHTELAMTHPNWGDTQERWMLGCLVAVGRDTVVAFYQDYASVEVDGEEYRPLLTYFRVSVDGGKTWERARPCAPDGELKEAIRQHASTRQETASIPNYVQSLPWACADPSGRVHLAFVDNRAGQVNVSGKRVSVWQVRFATMADVKSGFAVSERVSNDWSAERPPLDFIGCAADAENAWVIWTQNPNKVSGWDFTGDLYVGRKKLRPAPRQES